MRSSGGGSFYRIPQGLADPKTFGLSGTLFFLGRAR
jgi:hypothetical protein